MKRLTLWIFILCISMQLPNALASSLLRKPKPGDPFDTFPKNFWLEFSSPFTDTPEEADNEITETTTEPFAFFADLFTTVNVSVQRGQDVSLHCRVNDLKSKTISWMRRHGDELQLITFGRQAYATDSRYILEYQDPNDWKLIIQNVNESDEGSYECQVSSHPPLVLLIYLHVIVPQVEVMDERGSTTTEKYYKAGSTIELQCVISKVPHASTYITWHHGKRLLNYDTSRGGISVKTDMHPGRAVSRLYIAYAKRQDSGNYTCMLGNHIQGTVHVHVLNGEESAAMQQAGVKNNQPTLLLSLLTTIFVLYVGRCR